jgi:hypothetical protein
MQELQSKNPTIIPIDREIEWTIQQKPRDNVEEEEEEFEVEEMMAEQFVNQSLPTTTNTKTHETIFHPTKSHPAIMHRQSTRGRRKLLHLPTNTQCFDSLQGHSY